MYSARSGAASVYTMYARTYMYIVSTLCTQTPPSPSACGLFRCALSRGVRPIVNGRAGAMSLGLVCVCVCWANNASNGGGCVSEADLWVRSGARDSVLGFQLRSVRGVRARSGYAKRDAGKQMNVASDLGELAAHVRDLRARVSMCSHTISG